MPSPYRPFLLYWTLTLLPLDCNKMVLKWYCDLNLPRREAPG